MRLLLDTHTFIWWDSDPSKLSAAKVEAIPLVSRDAEFTAYPVTVVW